jgi:hypothetical protein
LKESIKKEILKGLIRERRWGGKHTEIRNISKLVSDYILNSKQGKKTFDKAAKELSNSGWLLAKKSTGEIHVSLNPKFSKEIVEYAKG